MQIIDLTHPLRNDSPIFPGDVASEVAKIKSIETDHYNAHTLFTGLHTSTHVDAPMHLSHTGGYICEYPLDAFAGKGVVIDAHGKELIDYDDSLDSAVSAGYVVLIYTGFDKYFLSSTADKYFNSHPAVTPQLADFLLRRKIKALGMDTPSPDLHPYPIHKRLSESGIFIIENMCNLEKLLRHDNFYVHFAPLKIATEASPVRAYAAVYP